MFFKFVVTLLPLFASLAGSVVAAPMPHDGPSKALLPTAGTDPTFDITAIAPGNGSFTDPGEAKDAAGAAASAASLNTGKAAQLAAGAMAAIAVNGTFADSTSNGTLSDAVQSTLAKFEMAKNGVGHAARPASSAFDAATAAVNASSIETDPDATSADPAVQVLFATVRKAQEAAALAAVATEETEEFSIPPLEHGQLPPLPAVPHMKTAIDEGYLQVFKARRASYAYQVRCDSVGLGAASGSYAGPTGRVGGEAPKLLPWEVTFCHFVIGIESNRTSSADYDADMQRAKAYGIDAFALNMQVELPFASLEVLDPYTDTQLHFAYDSAARNGMKVFISYSFNWWNTGHGAQIGSHLAQYAALPAQLFINSAAFVSSFAGDGVDVNAMRSAAGRPIMFVPNFHPGQGNFALIDGALNWFDGIGKALHCPNNGNNKAPSAGANVSVAAGDSSYQAALGGKPYLVPASPWFRSNIPATGNTHYWPEVSYSKNWVFPGVFLWFNRWNDLLKLGPAFIEIISSPLSSSGW
ncbi:glycosyl hydrolase family 71-domain-containing protein [Mycena vulgaris]|nr:glycosyl hydrolase family 71-domain-containing protein [Mycena vulgaris]